MTDVYLVTADLDQMGATGKAYNLPYSHYTLHKYVMRFMVVQGGCKKKWVCFKTVGH